MEQNRIRILYILYIQIQTPFIQIIMEFQISKEEETILLYPFGKKKNIPFIQFKTNFR